MSATTRSAPIWSASARRFASRSAATMLRQPRARRTWMVSRPIIPQPMTTTRSAAAGRRRSTAWTATDSGSTIAACSNEQPVGHLVENPRRHRDELGEGAVTAVIGAGDAEHHPRVAQVDVAAAAEVAAAARRRRIERDAIAGATAVTPAPTRSMTPAASWPITSGGMRRPVSRCSRGCRCRRCRRPARAISTSVGVELRQVHRPSSSSRPYSVSRNAFTGTSGSAATRSCPRGSRRREETRPAHRPWPARMRIGAGSCVRFNWMSNPEYKNIIVPPTEAEMTSSTIGWFMPIRRMPHPIATRPHTSQKYRRLSVTGECRR